MEEIPNRISQDPIEVNYLQYFIWDSRIGAYSAHPRPLAGEFNSTDFGTERNLLRRMGRDVIYPEEHAKKDSKEYLAYKISDTLLRSIFKLPKPHQNL